MGYLPALFKIRVAVVLPVANGVVLCRQNQYPFWVLPGGTLEPGEGVADCAIREVQEELGLTITVPKLLAVTDWVTPNRQVHELYFLGELTHAIADPATVGQGVDWGQEAINAVQVVPWADLEATPVQPAPIKTLLLQHYANGFTNVNGWVLPPFA
jgi:8-oxo-dGTP diphosphatase